MTPNGSILLQQPVNWQCPLTRGLVSWWAAIPGMARGVRWTDLCGRNHGTLTNMDPATDWRGPQGRPGGFGELACGGGVGEKVTVPTISLSSSEHWTISLWAKQSADDNNGMLLGDVSNNNDFLWISSATGFRYRNSASSNFDWTVSAATRTTMTHYVHAYNASASTATLYINSSSQGDKTSVTGSLVVNAISDGYSGSTYNLVGSLDDVQIRRGTCLSASEVAALYQDSLAGHPRMLNWIEPRYYVSAGAAPGGGIYKFPARMTGGMMEHTAGMRA